MGISSITGEGREAGLVTIVLECALATFTQRAVGFCCNVRCDKMEYGREIGHDVSRVCGVCVCVGGQQHRDLLPLATADGHFPSPAGDPCDHVGGREGRRDLRGHKSPRPRG